MSMPVELEAAREEQAEAEAEVNKHPDNIGGSMVLSDIGPACKWDIEHVDTPLVVQRGVLQMIGRW